MPHLKRMFFSSFLIAAALFTERGNAAEIQVDFALSRPNPRAMTGFLHGGSPSSPGKPMIAPLHISLWRTRNLDMYDKITGLGAQMQFILLAGWGNKTSKGWPYENPTLWSQNIRDLARRTVGKQIVWDVWNEPDNPRFWTGTWQQFFDTYRFAYQALRQELGPDVRIGGPSLTRYNPIMIQAFLEYCLTNRLEVNFLSWHELNDKQIPDIQKHLEDARQNFVNNPRYAPLKIQEITINEIVGHRNQYSPGDILGYFYYLEQGKADRAGKGCWPNLASISPNNCNNNSLDGLLDPATFQPRSPWWAYKFYADGYTARVAATTSDQYVVPLASKTSQNGGAQLLLGSFGAAANPVPMQVTFHNLSQVPGLPQNGKVHVRISRLPNSQEAVLAQPVDVQEFDVVANHNALQLSLPQLILHEAYLVVLLPRK